jgi:sensor c-di-GMP phosphodiesterase-like protein
MNRAFSSALLVLVCALSLATPIAVSVKLAEWQGYQDELARQLQLAKGLTRRVDATNLQIIAAFKSLRDETDIVPCSTQDINRMQLIALSSTYLKGVAYIAGNRILCSSMGDELNDFSLGPAKLVTEKKSRVWPRVKLPHAEGMTFFVLERNGYAVLSHQDLTVDVVAKDEDAYLGIFELPSHAPLVMRGKLKPEWMRSYHGEKELVFHDNDFLVAIHHSTQFNLAGLSAIPASYAHPHIDRLMCVFVPAGLGMGIALTIVIILLTRRHLSLHTEIQGALRRKEFFLLYQPIMDLQSGHCVGAEALIRWRRKDKRPVGPDEFIPVAEKSGLIRRITSFVIDTVGQDAKSVLNKIPDFHIGINFSSLDLQERETLEHLMAVLRQAGISPGSIMVEATEHGWMNAESMRDIVSAFRAHGLQVAIDDFGTGYSSLSYLANFDLDYLKIDKSFVDTLGTDAVTSHVALHIIEMAKSLQLHMIAEGVETSQQAAILRERGVQYAQGWLFARAMPMDELLQFIDTHNT